MKKIVLLMCVIFIFQAIGTNALCKQIELNRVLVPYRHNNYDMVNSPNNESCNILFIGSSYFNFNDLPGLFEKFVLSSEREVYIDHHGNNGMYLDDHASSSDTESKINEIQWDYVILQGGGTNTAYPDYFTDHPVYPALEILRDKIYQNCESTKMVFCMPWAFEDGMTWYQDWTDTYADMQEKIYETTINYSQDLGFIVAPVGWAWYTVLEEQDYPLHYLHLRDWNHPSIKGSYLMTCVIFSVLYLESSIDISYNAGIIEEEANYFKSIASNTVLDNLDLWNILNEGDNVPPETPSSLIGPINGEIDVEYSYSASTVDINNDGIYYLFDWGDGTDSDWIGSFDSGEQCEASHVWAEKDEYEIRVKAKDEYGLESEWSDSLVVSMPKNNYFDQFYSMSKKLSDTFSILNFFNDFFRGEMK